MTGQQRGPVEHGSRPGPVPMDVDVALGLLYELQMSDAVPARAPEAPSRLEALETVRSALQAARAYVRGQSPGRLEALAAALQEPVGTAVAPVDVDAVVQAYLTERNAVVVTREAAHRLGFLL